MGTAVNGRFPGLHRARIRRMSGPRRLAVLVSAMWIAFLPVAYMVGGEDVKWDAVVIFSAPVALAWGVWWVWRGFRRSTPN